MLIQHQLLHLPRRLLLHNHQYTLLPLIMVRLLLILLEELELAKPMHKPSLLADLSQNA